MDSGFEQRLRDTAARIESALDAVLGAAPRGAEIARPPRLLAAMRHATLGGGKRIRPFLVIECARLFGIEEKTSLAAALGFELVHTYSLVHDDLPAMDDDDLRRGRPTVHRAFDESTAILAGDALQTLAFDLLARADAHPDPAVRIALVACLAQASGTGGMAGGQMLDLAAEGRFGKTAMTADDIAQMQAMKTGALLAASCEAGAILGGADAASSRAIGIYGRALGCAFQIADDLLDVAGDADATGKAVGKDAARGKATLVATLGIAAARDELERQVTIARDALAPFGTRGETLAACATFVAARKS
jgi:farnesyl diphosphate synthase